MQSNLLWTITWNYKHANLAENLIKYRLWAPKKILSLLRKSCCKRHNSTWSHLEQILPQNFVYDKYCVQKILSRWISITVYIVLTDRKTRCAVQPRLWLLWLHGESDGCARLEHQGFAQRWVLHRERCDSDSWSQVATDDRSTGTGAQVDQKYGERKGM